MLFPTARKCNSSHSIFSKKLYDMVICSLVKPSTYINLAGTREKITAEKWYLVI